MIIKLWPAEEGEVQTIEFLVPQELAEAYGKAEQVKYQDSLYSFSGVAAGKVNFRKVTGEPFELMEEWRR
jgi:hypothetical protein